MYVERLCPEEKVELHTSIKKMVVKKSYEKPLVHGAPTTRPATTRPATTSPTTRVEKPSAEILIGYQFSDNSAEAILNIPVIDRFGAYVGVTSNRGFSVGVSYKF